MRAYRAFLLDEEGLVIRARIFEVRSDDEAAQLALAWAEGGRLELWSESRAIPLGGERDPQNSLRLRR